MKPLVDQIVKEGKDKKARFEAVFSKTNVKAKWFKNRQELFQGAKYHMKCEGDTQILEIIKPSKDDQGKYTVECMGVQSTAFLTVEGEIALKILVSNPVVLRHRYKIYFLFVIYRSGTSLHIH